MKPHLEQLLAAALNRLTGSILPAPVDPASIVVERAREAQFGDFVSNVALRLAKRAGRTPRELAEAIVAAGLEQFGAAGDAFDPNLHEALMHQVSPDLEEDTVAAILQPGYRFGERTLRVARVAVAQPGDAE